jgi:hypothetical protein
MQGRVNIKQREHFPYPLMLVGDVGMRRDFEKSTKDHPVQQVDPESGLRIWEAEVVNTDPEARKSERSFTVKLIAEHQPVPPSATDGSTMRPVVFANLEGLPWLDDRMCNGTDQPHKCRARIAWSYRATGFADSGDSGESAKDAGSSSGSPSGESTSTSSSSSSASSSGGKSSRSAA